MEHPEPNINNKAKQLSVFDKVKNAVSVALSNKYDIEVNPETYERYVMQKGIRRDLLAQEIREFLTTHIHNNKDQKPLVLDLASGTGIISKELSKNFQVISTDLSKIALDYGSHKNDTKHNLVSDLNSTLPFLDNSFDGITSVWANRFIKDPKEFLGEVHRVLKPDGTFVWPVFDVEIPFWVSRIGLNKPTSTDALGRTVKDLGFSDVETIKRPLHYNLVRRIPPVFATASYVIAKK